MSKTLLFLYGLVVVQSLFNCPGLQQVRKLRITDLYSHSNTEIKDINTEVKYVSTSIADELNGWNVHSAQNFLDKYWQKKPVLIRNAFPMITEDIRLLTEKDFFRLSFDEDVESRTLIKKRNTGKSGGGSEDDWCKEYGPFTNKYVENLPKTNWTILIQEIDRHIPEIADIWSKYFDFIPSWRRDDIMTSYASLGGGIGAHVDSYDVFLIQGR